MQKNITNIKKSISNYLHLAQTEGERGVAMMIAIIFFVIISTLIVVGLTGPTAREFSMVNGTALSHQSYFLAESGTEDAYYRIKNSMTIATTTTLVLGSSIATTTVTSISGGHEKDISTIGNLYNNDRSVSFVTVTGAGIAFNYGLESGPGGMNIGGGSVINGNLYSNGSIDAISATASGTVVAADSPALALDQSNMTPSTPPSSITFRNVATSSDFAQSFQISSTSPVTKVQLYIKKVGAPANATMYIVADNAGSPSTVTFPIGTATLTATSVATSTYSWVTIPIATSTAPSLVPNTTYWFVIDNSAQSTSNYYVIGANADGTYANGTAKTGTYGGTWYADTLDSYFQIYTGGVSAYIGGAGYVGGFTVGSGSVGDAWASNVIGTSVAGNLYCATGTNNNKSCNTGHGVASQVGMPFSDTDITAWKTTASSGGLITSSAACPGGNTGGNCTVDWHNASFGPGKITGNLVVDGGGTLTLTGTVWVVGSVSVNGGGKIELPPGYALNSETIVTDNIVNISGGGSLGSGTPGSYLFIVSTSRCPYDTYCSSNPAITVSGGAGAIAVDAQDGNVTLDGGATLDSAVGDSMTVTGGSTVTYNSGLASPSFTSGPSGSWVPSKWKEQ